MKETLDIQISDGAGVRDYEMYSGGEAFRVNFAIRLALSEVLAQRKGARLQTLVIDEGFGSQDIQGRQRLDRSHQFSEGRFCKDFSDHAFGRVERCLSQRASRWRRRHGGRW